MTEKSKAFLTFFLFFYWYRWLGIREFKSIKKIRIEFIIIHVLTFISN